MGSHALLSPSSAARWTACPPSARLCEHIEEGPSLFAQEGTEAHALCEYKVKLALGIEAEDPRPTLGFYNEQMEDCADEYTAFVMEALQQQKEADKDPTILLEQKVDISTYVPECSGTADCIIVSDEHLHVIDFKYGQGVPVSAERNTQMMLYALGAIGMFSSLYEMEQVSMTVFQPRLANVDTFTMSADELLEWAESFLKPRADLAFRGEGEFCSGSHCRFCKVKATCRARAEANLALARYEFAKPVVLGDHEIAEILTQADELASWVSDIKAYAFSVLEKGGTLEGFKLVEGRSIRRYTDEAAVADAVRSAGFDPYEHKVLGITAMTALLGRTRFNEILGSHVCKPKGKPTLVPESDKRPAITINDFTDLEEK
jgi:hypothetical protein